MREQWRKIHDFEMYEVSSMGRIRRNGKCRKPKINKSYEMVTLCGGGKMSTRFVHRCVLEAFHFLL